MARLRRAVLAVDLALARFEDAMLCLLLLLLTGVAFAQVVTRYGLNDPLIWTEESCRYLFVWIAMIGAARGLQQGAHYGLDALLQRVPRIAPACGIVATCVTAAFLLVLLVTGIAQTRLADMQIAVTLPFSMAWVYLALPVGAGLMLFHLAAHLVRWGPSAHLLGQRETTA